MFVMHVFVTISKLLIIFLLIVVLIGIHNAIDTFYVFNIFRLLILSMLHSEYVHSAMKLGDAKNEERTNMNVILGLNVTIMGLHVSYIFF